jgi:uncharacterized protein
MKRYLMYLLVLAFCIMPASLFAYDVPFLTGRVNDYAGILSAETVQRLSDTLKAHEDRTGNQVVILTISSLNGENLEDYANTVFNTWKLGQKEKNNGILILIIPNDRSMRIEVGYGLEPVLPDLLASRIIREVMTPKFKDGDYNGGISDGVSLVVGILNGGSMPDKASGNEEASGKSNFARMDEPDLPLTQRLLFGAFIFGIIGLFTMIGVFTPGGSSWFLYFFLIPFWAMFPIIVVGTHGALICLISYMVLFPVSKLFLRNTNWYKKAKKDLKTKGHASIGGFVINSGGSGGSSWSSGGGSSFSGGGGSSGGGGASGSW